MTDERVNETDGPHEPPRPDVEPGLLDALEEDGDDGERPAETAPAVASGDAAGPDGEWARVAEVLEAVPETGEPGDEADGAGSSGPGPEPEPVSEPEDAQEPVESDASEEDLAELRAIPLGRRVEALLFAASEPVSLARLRTLVAADDPAELRRVLDDLAAQYDRDGRAFSFHEVAGGIQLRTRPEMAPVVARLGRRRDADRLSPAALETLAIVAYRQPVLRADVEKIRGVASGEVLRTLVERGLVRVAGRAELPGSPLLYGTTPRFLEVFGLRNLRDLPSDEQLLRREG